MGMTPQQFHIIPTSCAILPPLTQICFVFITYNTKYVLLSAFFSSRCSPLPRLEDLQTLHHSRVQAGEPMSISALYTGGASKPDGA